MASVVLAEDEGDLLELVESFLVEEGFEVRCASDGRQALALIQRVRPDLLITDGAMPGLDGRGLLEAVRADPALRDLPVILVSGDRRMLEGHANAFSATFLKPFDVVELLAMARALISKSPPAEA
jgi:DNA-binding response OmpR family regulator